jgi:heavy metal sensor kinase
VSLRWKLTLWFAGTVTVVLAGFVAADYVGLSRNLERRIDETPVVADAAGPRRRLRAGLSRSEANESLREALWEHGLLALVTILGVIGVGHVVIRRALRPVRDMVSLARTITAEDLTRRIRAGGAGDELGELAETLNAMIARLERSFQHQRQFTGVVAHELMTPLTVLKGELELAMRRERSPAEHRELLPRLLTQIERLAALVDNLLLLSRMEAQSGALTLRPEPLDQLVLEVYEEYLGQARERGVVLTVDVPDRIEVRGEASLLRQLVANLVANGLRHTPHGGTVDVAVTAHGGAARLRVSDTGAGIPAEALPRVFEPFFRVDPSRSADTGGAGLGLAIVRKVADVHGCEVHLDSTVGAGTTVTVTWPPCPAPAARDAGAPAPVDVAN